MTDRQDSDNTTPATGIDLFLPLSGRTRREIEQGLRDLVQSGRLSPGTKLPPSRALAADIKAARNTVADAYAQLAAEGWLESRVGAGTWVAAANPTDTPHDPDRTDHLIDLRGGLVDAGDFPAASWATHLRQALHELPASAFGYPPAHGVAALRAALAGYLARTRGVAATPDSVMIGSGFVDLLRLVCRTLRTRGVTRIAVESHGHRVHRAAITDESLQIVSIDVDDEGARIDQLASSGAQAVLLTPAHQFPIGVPLSSRRRADVADWATTNDAWILEDDYDGEFRFDRRAVGALQATAPGRTIYFGTASKALAPAVGQAWAVAPQQLRPDLGDQRLRSGGQPSGLQQYALARFLDAFDYDRCVRRRRATFRQRRELLTALLHPLADRSSVVGLSAGLQCLVRLPGVQAEHRVVDLARTRGVRIAGISAYRAGCDPAPAATGEARAGVVVGYGAPTPARTTEALHTLRWCIAQLPPAAPDDWPSPPAAECP